MLIAFIDEVEIINLKSIKFDWLIKHKLLKKTD